MRDRRSKRSCLPFHRTEFCTGRRRLRGWIVGPAFVASLVGVMGGLGLWLFASLIGPIVGTLLAVPAVIVVALVQCLSPEEPSDREESTNEGTADEEDTGNMKEAQESDLICKGITLRPQAGGSWQRTSAPSLQAGEKVSCDPEHRQDTDHEDNGANRPVAASGQQLTGSEDGNGRREEQCSKPQATTGGD